MPATGKDIPKILFLLLSDGANHFVMQQLRETYNAVERGAQFVGHRGQERTLALVGLLG